MGFFDSITQAFDSIADAASAAARYVAEKAEELRRRIQEEAEKAAKDMLKTVTDKVTNMAGDLTRELEELLPNFDDKLQQFIEDVEELVAEAADEGVDITEAVNSAIDLAVKKVEEAKEAAIKAIRAFITKAREKLFELLHRFLPTFLHPFLTKLEGIVEFLVNKLVDIGEKLISNGISFILNKIKDLVKSIVRTVGEVLGPIWGFVKKLWKMIFGEKPEQCELVLQWFQERMERTERQFIYKAGAAPITAVIRKQRFFELLPPGEEAWKQLTLDYLARTGTTPGWSSCRSRIGSTLADSRPKPGCMVHVTWDQAYTDSLGGNQRVQVSVLYYRWKTEDFRKVSAGFLGVSAMVSAVDVDGTPWKPPQLKADPRRDRLTILPGFEKEIYAQLAPHLRLPISGSDGDSQRFKGPKRILSRQLKYMDEFGTWHSLDYK